MTLSELNKLNRKFWRHRRTVEKKIWKRGFVWRPALQDFLQRLADVPTQHEDIRIKYFRSVPSLNKILEDYDLKLAPHRRKLAQRERASLPRRQIRLKHADITALLEKLAAKPERAKQLWDPFIEGLGGLGYKPEIMSSRSDCESYQYVLKGKCRIISERQFINRISEIRSKRKKSLG